MAWNAVLIWIGKIQMEIHACGMRAFHQTVGFILRIAMVRVLSRSVVHAGVVRRAIQRPGWTVLAETAEIMQMTWA